MKMKFREVLNCRARRVLEYLEIDNLPDDEMMAELEKVRPDKILKFRNIGKQALASLQGAMEMYGKTLLGYYEHGRRLPCTSEEAARLRTWYRNALSDIIEMLEQGDPKGALTLARAALTKG